MTEPCTTAELLARVVALEAKSEVLSRVVALEAGLQEFRQVLKERDERYKQRASSQDDAVQTALQASEKAVSKAEAATERRLEGLNELRQLTNDQAQSFARKDEVKLLMQALEVRLTALDDQVKIAAAHGGGLKDAWAYLVAAIGVGVAILALFLRRS